ncbi:MAG: hypothetical protein QM528_01745 [Phycisphaerales bacterium]|nr:hypothetical protein [Phycisphaerales bacterium]
MSHHPNEEKEVTGEQQYDFTYSWVKTSRFIYYLSVALLVAFIFGNCFRLYRQRYKGKPDIEIQGSTKYVPEYK